MLKLTNADLTTRERLPSAMDRIRLSIAAVTVVALSARVPLIAATDRTGDGHPDHSALHFLRIESEQLPRLTDATLTRLIAKPAMLLAVAVMVERTRRCLRLN